MTHFIYLPLCEFIDSRLTYRLRYHLPLEHTEDVSPGSPLSVPLSCPSLRSASLQCKDKSLGPSVDDAGEGGDLWPLCPARMSVIMNLDRLR